MGRFAFVLRRLLAVIPLLVGIIFVVFLLLKITPGNPAREAVGLRASPQAVVHAARVMGLDQSVPGQFWHYLDGVIHGNLGYSFKTNGPVAPQLVTQAPITVWLIVVGVLLSLIITIPLATLAALRPDGVVDHIVRAISVTFLAMPVFWVGLMLLTVVAIPTGAFPVAGFGNGFIGHLHSITLPALTLAIGVAPVLVRSLRATMIEVLNSEYVSAARSLGVGGPRLFRRFVLRNALPPMVTLLAVQTGYLLFGAVIVETTFNLPGLGQGLVSAVDNADFPLVQGYTLIFAVAIVLIYLVADIVVAALDPRVVVES